MQEQSHSEIHRLLAKKTQGEGWVTCSFLHVEMLETEESYTRMRNVKGLEMSEINKAEGEAGAA